MSSVSESRQVGLSKVNSSLEGMYGVDVCVVQIIQIRHYIFICKLITKPVPVIHLHFRTQKHEDDI